MHVNIVITSGGGARFRRKTEFAWFDSELTDAAVTVVADMRRMTRWMKVSSPTGTELKG